MTPSRWALLREIFGKAMELREPERSRLLDSACHADPDLRADLERLLAEGAASSWQSPALAPASILELAPGEMVAHLRIESKIGEGGMGIVYRAYDTRLRRQVALKVLPPEHMSDPEWKQRFLREARAASALNHPNIVTVYDIGSAGDVDFISMEYIEGRPLAESIRPRGLPLTRALDHAIAIAEALTQAHQAGIIHRDLKPANIMVTADGRIKLLDFGLARQLHPRAPETITMTTTGNTAGSPHYMSPEQVRGLNPDSRTDIFSFGVLLYETLTGVRPFEGDTASHAMMCILEKEPAPLTRFLPEAPGELERILTKMLEKDSNERYQSARDLELDLKRLRQKLGMRARGDGGTPKRRWKTVAISLSAAAVLAAGLFVTFRQAPALTDKDTILVTDFVNTTGDPVFDDALKQGLSAQLEQSPFLSLVNDEQIHETLALMRQPPDLRITRQIGREICQRRGSKALIEGSIAPLGSHYVITLQALNAESGDSIGRIQTEAEGKERVLQSLGAAATNLRRIVGESITSIRKYDQPLEIATTSSLEALKLWSLSRHLNQRGRPKEGIPYARRAVELDPNFAMAYRALAMYHTGEPEKVVPFMQKAFDLRERASEPEKLLIEGDYHHFVTRDLDKALETLELLNQIYPRDGTARHELAANYDSVGQFEKEVEQARVAVRLTPGARTYNQLAVGFLRLNRFAEAKQTTEQAMSQGFSVGINYHVRLYAVAFIRGDAAGMKQQIDWAEAQPNFRDHLTWQAEVAAFRGQLKQAQTWQKARVRGALYGDCSGIRLPPGSEPAPLWNAAMASALCGDIDGAQSATDAYAAAQPATATVEHGYKIPELKAAIAIARNEPSQAVDVLQSAARFGGAAFCWPQYLRGQAYLKLKSGAQATAEFQWIIDHRGALPMAQGVYTLYPLAHLGLARAFVLAGDPAKSRAAYKELLSIWKDADQDLPVFIQAKAEYAALGKSSQDRR